ncbi:glycosyltransferase [Mucilaginibacter aquatilis]|uniref:Glycosyltransferase n=1 Tax=Mucilaginibacter aquatilis TaxID=1517760 RepID=A0A6I4ICN6_9SPHI|nr:glycosyltransferase [Mucilaginibacter aquatilis]MVN91199.1 glycosyltransferase [Mucilaginibacter aquatilis]
MKKIPILLVTRDRPTLLEKVLDRLVKFTDWEKFDLWILDNKSTAANKKIINMFKYRFPFINIYATEYNQLALIQNEVIAKLKADFYIKIDDDILVGEGWTNGFVGVCERNYDKMSFGSVVLPINGFGWVPFLDIMHLREKFQNEFPDTRINQDCMDVAVFKDKAVNEFIWNHCLNLDATVETFISNQNGSFKDLICPHRYSIGAIVFTHKFWETMGGWKVQANYESNIKKQIKYQKIAEFLKNKRGIVEKYSRLNMLADLLSNTYQGILGYEEESVFDYSQEKGLIIPVTTQSIAFHFSFGPVDQYLMNTVYHKIKF